jgi:hypothetical protein
MFRPEFVKLNPVPLSSDALSRFGGDDNAQHDKEILEATQRLIDKVIPSFATFLDARVRMRSSTVSGPSQGDATETPNFETIDDTEDGSL